jgi:Glycosyl transferase family 2
MGSPLEFSIIVEGFTCAEIGDVDRFRRSLACAVGMQQQVGNAGEVLVIDTSGSPELAGIVAEFPGVWMVKAIDLKYDDAKFVAAQEAHGEYLLYLDGDCLPNAEWLSAHLGALKNGADATGGFTRYDGGFLAAVESILDFGFLIPLKRRTLACYASNNSGFRRSILLTHRYPDSELRCNCYAHAQELQRLGLPVVLIPEARVLHRVQPFFIERYRQGFDTVGACWVNPLLRERRWLALGFCAAPLFYAEKVWLDYRRMSAGYRDLGVPFWALPFTLVLFPLFRLVDLAGMIKALASRPGPHGQTRPVRLPSGRS